MSRIATADSVLVGSSPADRAYLGSTLVGQRELVEVRRNLARYPDPGTNATSWLVFTGTLTPVTSAILTPDGYGAYWAKRIATGAAAIYAFKFVAGGRVELTAGVTYTASAWVYSDVAETAAGFRFALNDTSSGGAATTVATDVGWTRIEFTFTVPTTGVYNAAYLPFNGAVDDLHAAGQVLVEESATAGAYFDGTTSPDADLTPSWTGATGASESILQSDTWGPP